MLLICTGLQLSVMWTGRQRWSFAQVLLTAGVPGRVCCFDFPVWGALLIADALHTSLPNGLLGDSITGISATRTRPNAQQFRGAFAGC
jgi:hypothetical protein